VAGRPPWAAAISAKNRATHPGYNQLARRCGSQSSARAMTDANPNEEIAR